MTAPNPDYLDTPLPAYRDTRVVAIGADDVEFTAPVTVRVLAPAANGSLTYETAGGTEHTNVIAQGGDVIGPGDGLVLVRKILGGSTVTSVLIGIL